VTGTLATLPTSAEELTRLLVAVPVAAVVPVNVVVCFLCLREFSCKNPPSAAVLANSSILGRGGGYPRDRDDRHAKGLAR
jgi:hypothetical protein